jgi:hypothetical protein
MDFALTAFRPRFEGFPTMPTVMPDLTVSGLQPAAVRLSGDPNSHIWIATAPVFGSVV